MKKLQVLVLACGLALSTTGCANKVVKNWEASSGSRADATVEVGYIYNPEGEVPLTSDKQAHEVALQKCRFWGYQDAEPFGMVSKKCQRPFYHPFTGPMCFEMLVTRTYQCLGRGDASTPVDDAPQTPGLVKP